MTWSKPPHVVPKDMLLHPQYIYITFSACRQYCGKGTKYSRALQGNEAEKIPGQNSGHLGGHSSCQKARIRRHPLSRYPHIQVLLRLFKQASSVQCLGNTLVPQQVSSLNAFMLHSGKLGPLWYCYVLEGSCRSGILCQMPFCAQNGDASSSAGLFTLLCRLSLIEHKPFTWSMAFLAALNIDLCLQLHTGGRSRPGRRQRHPAQHRPPQRLVQQASWLPAGPKGENKTQN